MTEFEDHAEHSEERLHSTLESLLEGAQIIGLDWRYLYVNPAAARHGGRSVAELMGRTMMEAYPGIEHTAMFAALRRSMDTRVATKLENEFVTPDGTHKWFELVIQPVPEGLFVLSLEISDRKRGEEALRKNRARLEAIVENLHEGLILSDLAGNFLHWNRAALAMLGFSSIEEARGAIVDFAAIFEISTLDGTIVLFEQWPLARALRGEQFHDLELRVRRVGQQWERIFSYSGAAVRYSDVDSFAFVAISDITERKILEWQFTRAQRMESIGTLAGGIAHDLNNILMPIMLGVSVLRRSVLDERAARTIDGMAQSAKRAAALVGQVLSFARGVTTPWAAIDLRDVIGEVQSFMKSTFPKSVSVRIAVPGDLHPVTGDATQLVQVVLNLCVNAADAMPKGGVISISAANTSVSEAIAHAKRAKSGHYVVLEIADQGSGMSQDVLQRIFDPFFTTKESGKGTGLGLFTVQDIVRTHGGFTDVFSEVGRGTTFRVYLPARDETAAPATEVSIGNDLPRGHGETIMIVDDEVTILSVIKEILEAFGYQSIVAEDGTQAIELYARHRAEISVVVTDAMMPLLDGATLVAVLLRMNPDLHIIATSGSSSEDWRLRAERAGAKLFLTKPYNASLLLRMLADVLDGPPRSTP